MKIPANTSSTVHGEKNPLSVSRWQTLLRGPAPVVALLMAYLAAGLSAASRQSMTWDEGSYLISGASYWGAGDYRLCPENGNLIMRWQALPLWLGGYQLPPPDVAEWQEALPLQLADKYLYECGNDPDQMVLRGRQMAAVLSVALGLVVYLWSRQLFGPYGGLISLTLYVASPVVLSNGFLVTSDMAVALWFTAATWSLWSVTRRVTLWSLTASCLSLAALFLTKFSAVIIIPIGLVLLVARLIRGEPLQIAVGRRWAVRGRGAQLAILGGVCVIQMLFVAAMIWAAYGFRYAMYAPPDDRKVFFASDPQDGGGFTMTAIRFARDRHLLPEAYLKGFYYIVSRSKVCHNFLNGQFSLHGFPAFFPYCVAVKTPLATFLLLGLAAWACQARLRRRQSTGKFDGRFALVQLYEIAPLAVLLGVYWAFLFDTDMNVGVRYLLPAYPPIFILAGAAAFWFRSRDTRSLQTVAAKSSRWARGLMVAALAINVVEACWCWPHYLAYFNVLAGGPTHAYRHLVDSSLDWGQDLQGLKDWLDHDAEAAASPERVYFSYFGAARPDYYGIRAQPLLSHGPVSWGPTTVKPPAGGVYCFSATMLQNVYSLFPGRWNKVYEEYYQDVLRQIEIALQSPDAPLLLRHKPSSPYGESSGQLIDVFHYLQLARLSAFLRAREPDANVGHSILIYRLSDADVQTALRGPLVENLPEPEAKR